MFAEDPENSDAFSNLDSPVMDMVVPLMVSGFLLILGIIVVLIGIIVTLIGIKIILKIKEIIKDLQSSYQIFLWLEILHL